MIDARLAQPARVMRRSFARAPSRAFSLAEVLIASLMVAGLLVAVMNGVGVSARSARTMGDRQTGVLLAERLMNQIAALPYSDPQAGASAALGLDAGEDLAGPSTLDDVDDYHGLSEQPRDATGKVLLEFAGWTWTVRVGYVSTGGAASPTDTGLKAIRVEVKRGDQPVASLSRVRSAGADAVLRFVPGAGQTLTRDTQDSLP